MKYLTYAHKNELELHIRDDCIIISEFQWITPSLGSFAVLDKWESFYISQTQQPVLQMYFI